MSKTTTPKTADDWAKQFKLHSCIGNQKFAEQVKAIQEDAVRSYKQSQVEPEFAR